MAICVFTIKIMDITVVSTYTQIVGTIKLDILFRGSEKIFALGLSEKYSSHPKKSTKFITYPPHG